ncbi:MAG: nitrilase [Gemmatimonadetes bacterium]|nr:nitrilase [Gemmatimonadota bacterium]
MSHPPAAAPPEDPVAAAIAAAAAAARPCPPVTVAVVQAAPVSFDLPRTLETVAARTAEAAARGAQLVLFPEAFVSAYPRGISFGAVVGHRTEAGRAWFQRYWASSITVPGPAVDALGAIAARHAVTLAIGVIERDGGTLYCVLLVLGPDGTLLAKHRKVMPTASERLVWGYGDGTDLAVVDTPAGRVGGAICWENYMPLLRHRLYAQGVELYLAPTADARERWVASMRHIALEGRCYVLSANQCTRRRDYPDDYPLEGVTDPDALVSRGGSCIVDPAGEVIAGPVYDAEAVLVATLDPGALVRGKFDFDAVGHYALVERHACGG